MSFPLLSNFCKCECIFEYVNKNTFKKTWYG